MINFIVNRNFAPVLSPLVNLTLGTYKLPFSFARTFWHANVTDAEGDNVVIDCSVKTTTAPGGYAWLNLDVNASGAGNITLYGTTPRSNTYAGSYTYTCSINDQYSAPPNTYVFNLIVDPKTQIVFNTVQSSVSSRLPVPIYLNMTGYSIDP